MAALQCEICGGKLVGKSGGLFECEYCGMQYDKTRIHEMIQEIKGTVKVEGTVQVAGTVKIDGPVKVEDGPSLQTLLKLGWLALEDMNWESAESYFNKVLERDPESAEAYLGKLHHRYALQRGQYHRINYRKENPIVSDEAKNVLRFGDAQLKAVVKQIGEEYNEAVAEKKRQLIDKLRSIRQKIQPVQHLLSASKFHTVAVRPSGIVEATKYDMTRTNVLDPYCGQCDISEWEDIVAVSAGPYHTVGLKSDGSVVATQITEHENENWGQCDVSGWRDIVAVAAGSRHTVGLKSDGTVVATKFIGGKDYDHGQCEVSGWRDIVAVSVGYQHSVGLKSDGTVVATRYKGDSDYNHGQCEVSEWKDIVAISAGPNYTVGLKNDGTVVITGGNSSPLSGVTVCNNVVAISAGYDHVVVLKADGTVSATNNSRKYIHDSKCLVSSWKNVVAVAAGYYHTVCLKSDGTVESTYINKEADNRGQRDVSGWRLFYSSCENLEQERKDARIASEERKEKNRIQAKRRSSGLCQHCGGQLKGFLVKKCVSCGNPKDY